MAIIAGCTLITCDQCGDRLLFDCEPRQAVERASNERWRRGADGAVLCPACAEQEDLRRFRAWKVAQGQRRAS